jgi:hypothetical protein
MATKTFRRMVETICLPGIFASIHRHHAEMECRPDPRDDALDEDMPWEAHQQRWEQRVIEGRIAADVLSQRRIAEAQPIPVIWLHAGIRRDGVGVPDIVLLTEGFPLRITPDDRVELDGGASAQRRAQVNAVREQRGYPRIPGLEGPDWLRRVRQYLIEGPQPIPDTRSHNGFEVV